MGIFVSLWWFCLYLLKEGSGVCLILILFPSLLLVIFAQVSLFRIAARGNRERGGLWEKRVGVGRGRGIRPGSKAT